MNRILLIDNYDSFTYNLLHLIKSQYPGPIDVLRDYEISIDKIDDYSAIIISPGPGRPKATPIVKEVLDNIKISTPVLGICLGMQCINEYFGGKTVRGVRPIHGKVSIFTHKTSPLFKNIPKTIEIARYHSLVIEPSKEVKILGYSKDGTIMAITHKTRPIYGLQFHPESFLTEYGDKLVSNFFVEYNLI
ncbi:aminodeoxychorismate/anthranilate synthase component II [Thiospirochaeta perfilievii]|uniref:Aminodeoxychorismate/anthranilate synthase component II n=1 Tax=Thiospirochaeta perfilievii TaxID=252967 RepID=A0A5C1QHG7_9SPIO|nr:aminodeoxychorismate/anthranilate synthase component II [Thiospirochaeta perfilievii]QEN05994.1 aminodeoxychorismate/anthranilate synthase component II [Thiospirochaeta perfilievii]